jgi:hypothetical protein
MCRESGGGIPQIAGTFASEQGRASIEGTLSQFRVPMLKKESLKNHSVRDSLNSGLLDVAYL